MVEELEALVVLDDMLPTVPLNLASDPQLRVDNTQFIFVYGTTICASKDGCMYKDTDRSRLFTYIFFALPQTSTN
jgi:hypothetical protein